MSNGFPRQMSLRAFLASTLFLCVVLGVTGRWIVRLDQRRSLVSEIESSGGVVGYEYQTLDAEAPGPSWVRSILGDDAFATVGVVWFVSNEASDNVVGKLKRLSSLNGMVLSGHKVTDASVDTLRNLPKLRELGLFYTSISPNGIKQLASIESLERLILSGSHENRSITDAHVAALRGSRSIKTLVVVRCSLTDDGLHLLSQLGLDSLSLHLDDTSVSDHGMQYVANLGALRDISILGTAITEVGLLKLREAKGLQRLTLELNDRISEKNIDELKNRFADL